jgi:hypothetical protein
VAASRTREAARVAWSGVLLALGVTTVAADPEREMVALYGASREALIRRTGI